MPLLSVGVWRDGAALEVEDERAGVNAVPGPDKEIGVNILDGVDIWPAAG